MKNFGILTPGDRNFDLSEKMTEMISKWFFASFRTLPFVFLYGDQEPRSWGGRSNAPPPAGGGKSRGPAGRGLSRSLVQITAWWSAMPTLDAQLSLIVSRALQNMLSMSVCLKGGWFDVREATVIVGKNSYELKQSKKILAYFSLRWKRSTFQSPPIKHVLFWLPA